MNVCYTALIGDYEELKQPTVITPGWEYICYTDLSIKNSGVWQIKKIKTFQYSPRLVSRRIKILGFTQWEKSIWVDASFQVDVDLNMWWSKYFIKDFAAPKHPLRDCVYHEIEACIISKFGEEDLLRKQKARYKDLQIPEHNGIITSGILMRTPSAYNLCREWWMELCKGSSRDQVAFAKASIGHSFTTYGFDYRKEQSFIYHQHFARRGNKTYKPIKSTFKTA